MRTILFVIAIFVSIWFGSVNLAKLIRGNTIYWWNFFIMSAAITAVITHIIGVW